MHMSYNNKPPHKRQYNKVSLLFFIIFAFFTITLVIGIIKLTIQYHNQTRVLARLQIQEQESQKEKNKLLLKLKQAKTQEYIEKHARELTLAKENETIVVGSFPTPAETPKQKSHILPIYVQWYTIFFHL